MLFRCYTCDEDVAGFDLLNHVRLLHPDAYPTVWPDGDPVPAA